MSLMRSREPFFKPIPTVINKYMTREEKLITAWTGVDTADIRKQLENNVYRLGVLEKIEKKKRNPDFELQIIEMRKAITGLRDIIAIRDAV